MSGKRFLSYALPPTPKQQRLALVLVSALAAGLLFSLPFADLQLAVLPGFIGVTDAVMLVVDVITASLLFAQFWILRSRALLPLAAGYLVSALLLIPHALTYPGAVTSEGLLGSNMQSPVWLYVFIHLALPLAAICYAILGRRSDQPMVISPAVAISTSVATAVFAAIVITLITTRGVHWLPPIMSDVFEVLRGWPDAIAVLAIAVIVSSMYLVWRQRSTVLDLWLLVMLASWLIESTFLFIGRTRYGFMWYLGRGYLVFSSSFVMIMLLAEWTRLHARVAIDAAAREREIQHKRMSLEMVVDAMARELDQPLCAITANSDAAETWLRADPPNVKEARLVLQDIGNDGERISRVFASTRDLLMQDPRDRTSIPLDSLLEEALMLLRVELRAHEVEPSVELARNLPMVHGNRNQLLQLFVNLLTNAIESLSVVTDRSRDLHVRASRDPGGSLVVLVEDSGVGIAPADRERLFKPFFTTKDNHCGLGLALCRMIIDAHDGEISVRELAPFGSAFRVVLPAAG